MRFNRSILISVAVVGAALSASAMGQTTTPPTDMNLTIQTVGGSNWNWQNAGSPGTWTQDAATQRWSISGSVTRPTFDVTQFALSLDADPFVSNAFTLVNNTAVTQTYTVSVVLPVTPALAAFTQTLGSFSISILDSNGNSTVTAATTGPGSAMYNAYIDGVLYQQLAAHPTTYTASGTPGATLGSGPLTFSFPSGQPGVATSIGITNTFTLTPGDTAQLVSSFFIAPEIPAPGALGLLGLGGLVAARRRRN